MFKQNGENIGQMKKIHFSLIVTLLFTLLIPTSHVFAQEESSEKDWQLVLVNEWQALPDDYEVDLIELRNGFFIDERIYTDIQAMFANARLVGIYPLIVSAHREAVEQQQIIDERVAGFMAHGMAWQEAVDETMRTVALPGHSEHETGLAVDINAENEADQAVYDWLAQNAHHYGFIVRYPANKIEETGIDYEPWHFRYVGKEHAKYIYDQDVSLEFYVELLGK